MEAPKVGRLVEGEQGKDAIHVAVVPVVAGEALHPGTPIGKLPDGTFGAKARVFLGIVDPFLQKLVNPGERFWLFLNPGTTLGLRHVWSHPAFPDIPVTVIPPAAHV